MSFLWSRHFEGEDWEVTPNLAMVKVNGAVLLHQCLVQRGDDGKVAVVKYAPIPILSEEVIKKTYAQNVQDGKESSEAVV